MDFEMPDAINAFGDSFLTMMAAVVVVCVAGGPPLLLVILPIGEAFLAAAGCHCPDICLCITHLVAPLMHWACNDPFLHLNTAGYAYYRLQRAYRAASTELKRLDSISRSPVYSQARLPFCARPLPRASPSRGEA